MIKANFAQKKLIIFDLDGTLTVSKSKISPEMEKALSHLLSKKDVAVISGGEFKQFQKQFLNHLTCPRDWLKNLHLFPTCGACFFEYQGGIWKPVYQESLTPEEKAMIFRAFELALKKSGLPKPEKLYGAQLEDRGTQVTFSGLGQETPVALKYEWDPKGEKRKLIVGLLGELTKMLDVKIAGTTSIDVTRKGINKAYGIAQMEKHLKVPKAEMLFIGDTLFPGGNDYPVMETGVDCITVSGPEETLAIITSLVEHF